MVTLYRSLSEICKLQFFLDARWLVSHFSSAPDEMFREAYGRFVDVQDRYSVLHPEVSASSDL